MPSRQDHRFVMRAVVAVGYSRGTSNPFADRELSDVAAENQYED
jgi:hypothetical protein